MAHAICYIFIFVLFRRDTMLTDCGAKTMDAAAKTTRRAFGLFMMSDSNFLHVCICKPSATNFLKTVVADIVAMYKEVDAPLTTMHTGGDEVPNGVWVGSPECQKYFADHSELNNDVKALHTDFLRRMYEILQPYNLTLAQVLCVVWCS